MSEPKWAPDTNTWFGNKNLMMWLACGRRGCSSNTMVEQLTGIPAADGDIDHPYDPGDFDRCLALLEAVPVLRLLLPQMASASPKWAALVSRWAEIERSHLDEIGLGWTKARSAPKTYALIESVLNGANTSESST